MSDEKKQAERYKFGGALKGVGWYVDRKGDDVEITAKELRHLQPPATPQQVTMRLAYWLSMATPGNPAWYDKLMIARGRGAAGLMGIELVTFKPGRKPVLPAGVKRIEDIEGYLPDDDDEPPF